MTEEERERFKQEGNKFDGKYQRDLLRHALRIHDSPGHHAAKTVDNLHIHPDDCRPSFIDILGASINPDDLSIVMTRNHLYISLFPNRPHPTAPLKDRLNTLGIRYKGPKYIYDEESSIFRHASSAIANQENQAPEFINDLLKEIETPALRLKTNSKRNLKMILEEIKKQPIAAQIFKNAYESQEAGKINQKIITALKNVIEIMNAFFLDKKRQPKELAFYLNHGSLTDHTLIKESLLLKELCSAPALSEGDLGKYLEQYFGIKIIKMPLNSIIPAHLMTAFEEKKQAYIQELFDKATEIDLKNNLYHRYYLNQYQINSFDQGVNLIKKVNPIKEEDSYNNDFNDLLENFLKDHVNSLKLMKALLSGVTKRNLATILMIIYRQVPEKIELFKQALSQDQISSIEETVEILKSGEFLNTDFNLQ
jgi:hypothetical protein